MKAANPAPEPAVIRKRSSERDRRRPRLTPAPTQAPSCTLDLRGPATDQHRLPGRRPRIYRAAPDAQFICILPIRMPLICGIPLPVHIGLLHDAISSQARRRKPQNEQKRNRTDGAHIGIEERTQILRGGKQPAEGRNHDTGQGTDLDAFKNSRSRKWRSSVKISKCCKSVRCIEPPLFQKREPLGSPWFYSAVNGSNAILRARLIATVTWR